MFMSYCMVAEYEHVNNSNAIWLVTFMGRNVENTGFLTGF